MYKLLTTYSFLICFIILNCKSEKNLKNNNTNQLPSLSTTERNQESKIKFNYDTITILNNLIIIKSQYHINTLESKYKFREFNDSILLVRNHNTTFINGSQLYFHKNKANQIILAKTINYISENYFKKLPNSKSEKDYDYIPTIKICIDSINEVILDTLDYTKMEMTKPSKVCLYCDKFTESNNYNVQYKGFIEVSHCIEDNNNIEE